MGTPYHWGGENPGGFDCSGLLQYVWSQKGVQIPRVTYDQFKTGTSVAKSQLRPGDAVFFMGSDPKNGLPGHVGMYIGGGKFIEAPHTGSVVRISTLAGRSDYVGARRYG
jgi:cell wall-associated NlpC family hydrolase